ncbi:MAG: hypothetical protein ACRDN9_08640 [Streptosporangiaceae bacterium]
MPLDESVDGETLALLPAVQGAVHAVEGVALCLVVDVGVRPPAGRTPFGPAFATPSVANVTGRRWLRGKCHDDATAAYVVPV